MGTRRAPLRWARAHRGSALTSVAVLLTGSLLAGCSDERGSVGRIPDDPPAVLVGRVHSLADWGLRLQVGDGQPTTLGWADDASVYRQYAGTSAQLGDGDCVSLDLDGVPTAPPEPTAVQQLFVLGRVAAAGAPPPTRPVTTDLSRSSSTAPAPDECAALLQGAITPGRWSGRLSIPASGGFRLTGIVQTGAAWRRTAPTAGGSTVASDPTGLSLALTARTSIWLTAEGRRDQIAVGDCATVAVTRQFGLPAVGRITLHPAGRDVCGRVTGDSEVMVPVSHWGATPSGTTPATLPSRRPTTS
jgi:hypothetical protein